MSLATPAFPQPQQQLQLRQLLDIPYLHSTPDSPLDVPWLPDALEPARDLRPGKRSNHHSSKKSKKKRRKRRQRLGTYALQLIGLLCLVLAALKGFEPLTGVGFTFVMIGYKQGLGKGEKTRGTIHLSYPRLSLNPSSLLISSTRRKDETGRNRAQVPES